jgi:hypothetical protein
MKRGVSMKKAGVITLCFVLLFGFASLAYAELPANRIALGVQLGATVSQVRNVFGVPDRTTKEQMKSEAYGDFVETTMIYGNNSIVVKFYDENVSIKKFNDLFFNFYDDWSYFGKFVKF